MSLFDAAYAGRGMSEHRETVGQVCRKAQRLLDEGISLDRFAEYIKCIDEIGAAVKDVTNAIIQYYSAMSKSEYKTMQQQFEQKHGVKFDALPAFKKTLQKIADEQLDYIGEARKALEEALWLHGKFGEGTYADIPGLCKSADMTEIEEKGWSLTPGAYVGVAPAEDDGVDFAQRMKEIHSELLSLQAESDQLMETISRNMKEMGL